MVILLLNRREVKFCDRAAITLRSQTSSLFILLSASIKNSLYPPSRRAVCMRTSSSSIRTPVPYLTILAVSFFSPLLSPLLFSSPPAPTIRTTFPPSSLPSITPHSPTHSPLVYAVDCLGNPPPDPVICYISYYHLKHHNH